VRGQGNVCEVYEYSVRERGGWKGTVVWGSDNVPCPMNTDFRNDADSICYISAGMYAMYLHKSMLVKKIPVGVRFSAPLQTSPGAHPASYTKSNGSLSQG